MGIWVIYGLLVGMVAEYSLVTRLCHRSPLYPIDVTWLRDSEHLCHLKLSTGIRWLIPHVCVGLPLVTLNLLCIVCFANWAK